VNLTAPAYPPALAAALAQRPSEVPFDTLLETSPDALIAIGPDGTIAEWNEAAEGIFGYTRAFVLGQPATKFLAPSPEREPIHKELARSLKSGRGRLIGRRTEMTALRASGGEFTVELTLARAAELGPMAFTVHVRDVTERKLEETILRKSEERFRLLIEGVEEYAIHLLDPRGRVLTWNAGVERIDGYRARDIIGRRFSRLYTPEDVARGKPEQALMLAGANGHCSQEGWGQRKDGTRYWASVVLTALRSKGGELFGFSRIGCDHTKRREAEIEAARLTKELKAHLQKRTAELQAARQRLRKLP